MGRTQHIQDSSNDFYAQERSKASFEVNDLSLVVWGSQEKIDRIHKLQRMCEEDPLIRYDPKHLGASREEIFMLMAQRTRRMHELLGFHNTEDFNYILSSHIDNQPFCGLHWKMFIPTIKYLGTDKQVKYWIPLAESHQIFGTYAQTELGHGSDVQSLETTATFDIDNQEFIINSPTLSSTKWWPGELGITSTHVVAFAQLLIDGKNYGVQAFIVQIRDTETHEPLPGITVGDLGVKMGYNAKDNGYLRMNNIRIPRENMLMRYAKVSKSGIFSKPKNEKVGYACMMEIRTDIIASCSLIMARTLTIGTRYSLFRTQFKDSNGIEKKVLDYQLQQEKIIPYIAETYALLAGGRKITRLHQQNIRNIFEREDFSLFKDYHAIASGCKAVYTSRMLEAIEKVRQACGGHGFSAFSRFVDIYHEFSPFVTYEGENTVLSLQTASYLVKGLNKSLKGEKIPPFIEYLKCVVGIENEKFVAQSKREVLNIDLIRKCLRYKAAYLVSIASQKIMEGLEKGLSMKETWDSYAGINLVDASTAHVEYFTYTSFLEMIVEASNEKVKEVLIKLCLLYGIQKLISNPSSFFENGYMTGEQFKMIKQAKEDLLFELRNEALSLVEAFCYSDGCLGALGRSDGKVYETLYDWAANQNRLNDVPVQKAIQAELRKIRDVSFMKPSL
ncbi:hypothetical protein ABPG72_021545 [Tetrahymena utriculariae]